jgi:hypothetical protein
LVIVFSTGATEISATGGVSTTLAGADLAGADLTDLAATLALLLTFLITDLLTFLTGGFCVGGIFIFFFTFLFFYLTASLYILINEQTFK